ncbi:hypothetical protein N7537_010699 [Penicillium hordei]|uniref:Uncharacterized protein n=1 Tax=Penicillium hordei TaxID=40994 RepID=A0AAD6DKS4_9EURO|nr:uncharacterized protein N7537_010699 [Penicillium hordei]KAJ5588021.1 hypothetical protein N7537_010699 [Penicillium hordei]
MPLENENGGHYSMNMTASPEANIFQDFQQFTNRFSADEWTEHLQTPVMNSRDPTIGHGVLDQIYDSSNPYPQNMGLDPSDDTEFETSTTREHQLSLEDELLLTLRNERSKT